MMGGGGGAGAGSAGAGGGRVEVISSKGCSRLFVGLSPSLPSFKSVQSFEATMSPASSSIGSESLLHLRSNAPFSGLVICVTGLSKEARNQVMEATERLGGQYSPDLHPQCTHLVVQISFNILETIYILFYTIKL
ncbi:hypothetical protein Pint_13639 [Pistacia integerrima]|uniref:Uncharacterized protein n=1 Tax=Pistacia integerrima TaxID=434235 RepID=A0ACC0YBX6_9ROSI|nr:hypothetical protein Pint_13639 [Pistacia integerrima]